MGMTMRARAATAAIAAIAARTASLVGLAGAVLVTGCAAPPGAGAIDWSSGAKHGWVVGAYVADIGTDGAPIVPPCLAALPAGELARRHVVMVRYRHVRSMHTEVAELPPGVDAAPGDRIELWPASCATGKISRITKVFPATVLRAG